MIIAVLLSLMPIHGHAAQTQQEIEYLDDGSYIVTTITESPSRAGNTKTGTKTDHYYNSDSELQWTMTVTGTFSYDGSTSTCTNVTGSTSITNTKWYVVSESTSRNGNTATYDATMGYKVLGITINKEVRTLNLSCDKNGNLS